MNTHNILCRMGENYLRIVITYSSLISPLFYDEFLIFVFSIGRPKHVRVMEGALEGDLFLGPEAEVTFNLNIVDSRYLEFQGTV